jgi:hypothetical protein
MSRVGTTGAAERLARRLVETEDTGLRARILQALRTMQTAGVAFALDKKRLVELAERTIDAHARALAFRLAHARMLAEAPAKKTPGGELLQSLLRDREIESTGRLYLALGLLHPRERFARIRRGLASGSPKARASSRELLENVVRPPLREKVLALAGDAGDAGDAARLRALGRERPEKGYTDLLRAMIEQGGELGALAAYHAHEIGLGDAVRAAVEKLGKPTGAFGEELSQKHLESPPSEPNASSSGDAESARGTGNREQRTGSR